MRRRTVLISFAVIPMLALAVSGGEKAATGEYLEARNADVWTGPCFANGEMGVVGNRAIMAWKVREGAVDGVKVDGLSVVAVVSANHTLGLGVKVAARSLLIVDSKANDMQRQALIQLAKSQAADTLGEIIAVRTESIALQIGNCGNSGCSSLEAGPVQVRTRCLAHKDSICGHEKLFYSALAKITEGRGAYTLANAYDGPELEATFRDDNARSAILGKFAVKTTTQLAVR